MTLIRLFFLVMGFSFPAVADVSVPPIFSNHAVLQASEKTPVWGRSAPGEKVTVTLGPAKGTVTANPEGKWLVNLDLRNSAKGPFDLVISGNNLLSYSDVLVGQVWLCSGQSNMDWPLRATPGAAEEIARSGNSELRQFLVERVASPVPLEEAKGTWVVAGPQTAPAFTAVGYYFGKTLQHDLQSPVGLINASVGGTPVEAWASPAGFDSDPVLRAGVEKARNDYANFANYIGNYRAWQEKHGRLEPPVSPDKTTDFLKPEGRLVKLPGFLATAGLPDAGVVWVSRKITLPPEGAGGSVDLFLGDVRDSVKVYWNGTLVAEGGIDSTIHRYVIPGKYVTPGESVLSLRLFNPSGGMGIAPGDARFSINCKGGNLPLEGEWLARMETEFPKTAETSPSRPSLPLSKNHVAGYLFDGMIRPLIPYAIAGVIWYQGEQNFERGRQYGAAFPLMIADWRKQWGRGNTPFYFCQLANFQARQASPSQSSWAEVREGQAEALALPATGQAVLIDVGDADDIHPPDKKTPGERLARIALTNTYGYSFPASPVLASWKVDENKIRVEFRNADGGLKAGSAAGPLNRPDSELQGFSICGEDHVWKWADAKIEGNAVWISHPEVPSPVAVRYAWADNPLCNLINGAGLPAAPFRTDDFPGVTEREKY